MFNCIARSSGFTLSHFEYALIMIKNVFQGKVLQSPPAGTPRLCFVILMSAVELVEDYVLFADKPHRTSPSFLCSSQFQATTLKIEQAPSCGCFLDGIRAAGQTLGFYLQ